MTDSGSTPPPAEVVVAGGGFAALEAVLALRALAAERVRVTLISPDPALVYRPAATVEAFDSGPPRAYDLQGIAGDLGAGYRPDRVEAVNSRERRVRLASGAQLRYDALVLALGGRATASVPGTLTFRDQRDVPTFQAVLEEMSAKASGRLMFAVPSGCSWPLPLYELAMFSAGHFQARRLDVEVALVSPERTPLELFGAHASRLVADLLHERGVRFVGRTLPHSVRADGSLALQFDAALKADRVVAAPQLRGNPIPGLPASWWGFVPTDSLGRVEGLADVYAVGDMTTFPIKQGGLAAQQADRVAHTIADGLGVAVGELSAARVLKARLLGGDHPLLLSVELDEHGQPMGATLDYSENADGVSIKVFGRYLTGYLAGRDPTAGDPTLAA